MESLLGRAAFESAKRDWKMTLVLLVAAGVVLGLIVFWIIFATARGVRDNENLQGVLSAIVVGLGFWWWWEMGYKVLPL